MIFRKAFAAALALALALPIGGALADATSNLGLTPLSSGQAQKEVTTNTSFERLAGAVAQRCSTAMSDSTTTLTSAQALPCSVLDLTGALTGDRNLVVPTVNHLWVVKNGTTGSHAVTVKTASGTGIAVANGAEQILRADGTNVVAVSPSATPSFADLSGSASCAQLPALTGDGTTSAGSCAVTVVKVNGVAYAASPATNTVPVVTASNTATYEALPSCADSAGQHLNYDTAAHTFACGTSTSGGSGTVTVVGAGSLTSHAPVLGGGSQTLKTTAAMTDGQLLVGATSADAAPQTVSGDATMASTGALTVSKTGGVSFAASATTDTTSASNIGSGTLASARGGAGTINGALKGNGSGVVSQAACADLSNGATGCSTATGTSGATLPLLNGANSWSAAQRGVPVTVSISTSTFTPDFAAGNNFSITLVHASCPCTLANPSNIVAGQAGQIIVNQSATGSDLISTYGGDWKFPSGTAPTLSAGVSAVDILSYYVIDSTHIAVSAGLNFQ